GTRRRPSCTQASRRCSPRTDLEDREPYFHSKGGWSMIPANVPIQRPADARLLVVNSRGQMRDLLRSSLPTLFHPGDIVVANDAATLPASIFGVHKRSGRSIEVRLAGSESVFPEDVKRFSAVVFGEGNYRTPTERRPSPPELRV